MSGVFDLDGTSGVLYAPAQFSRFADRFRLRRHHHHHHHHCNIGGHQSIQRLNALVQLEWCEGLTCQEPVAATERGVAATVEAPQPVSTREAIAALQCGHIIQRDAIPCDSEF